jgi:hypothetical protein
MNIKMKNRCKSCVNPCQQNSVNKCRIRKMKNEANPTSLNSFAVTGPTSLDEL